MAPVMTEAIKEFKLKHRDELESDISALEKRLKALQKEGN
jgi:hypothetical protein